MEIKGVNIKTKLIIAVAVVGIVLIGLVIFFAARSASVLDRDKTYIKGVDVSVYQGNIDWKTLAKQDIYFAYIKASEGTDFTDPNFETNWSAIDNTDLKKGAYHFVTFDESGKKQAEHFISLVSAEDNDLPPAIDLELYGKYLENPPDAKTIYKIVEEMMPILEEHFGMKPVIYTNYLTYNEYLTSSYLETPIWICDISDTEPDMKGEHQWKFWQYDQRHILQGYDGKEKFIDINLYNGNYNDFVNEFGN